MTPKEETTNTPNKSVNIIVEQQYVIMLKQ